MSSGRGLQRCAALLPGADSVPDSWVYSAIRLVMVAGTHVLSGGVPGALDGLLQAFLADTLQAGGIAIIVGSLELCGPGVALTGARRHIDQAERALGQTRSAEDLLVRHSLELAGPWTAAGHRQYRQSSQTGRWVARDP